MGGFLGRYGWVPGRPTRALVAPQMEACPLRHGRRGHIADLGPPLQPVPAERGERQGAAARTASVI